MKSRTLEPLPTPTKLGILISGGGRTFQNLKEEIDAGRLPVEATLVIASRPGIGGIFRADAARVPCRVIDRKAYVGVQAHSDAVFTALRDAEVDLVILAGWLSLLAIPDDFRDRVLNIHPSLIPSFCGKGLYGMHVHKAVLDRGVKVSGCTVHFADPDYDEGPIIRQTVVPVEDEDTPETLAARVFEAECLTLPAAIRDVIAGGLAVEGKRVTGTTSD